MMIIHYNNALGNDRGYSACPAQGPTIPTTRDKSRVTCKRCLKILGLLPKKDSK